MVLKHMVATTGCSRFDRSDFLQIVNHHRSIRSIVTYIYTHIYTYVHRFDRFDYVNDSIDFRFLQLVGDAYEHGDKSSGVSDEMDAAIEDEAWLDKHETDAGENWHEHGWGTDGWNEHETDWWSDYASTYACEASHKGILKKDRHVTWDLSVKGLPNWFYEKTATEQNDLKTFFSQASLIYATPQYESAVKAFNISDEQRVEMENVFHVKSSTHVAEGTCGLKLNHPKALVVSNNVVESALAADKEQAKVKSNRAKYMRFLRAGRNPLRSGIGALSLKKFQGDMRERLEVYRTWQQSDEDWVVCEVKEKRFHELLQRKKVLYAWKNQKQLLEILGNDAELCDKVITECMKNKNFHRKHAQFPQIKQLTEYYVRMSDTEEHEEVIGKVDEMNMSGRVDKEVANAWVKSNDNLDVENNQQFLSCTWKRKAEEPAGADADDEPAGNKQIIE